jgi:hypothetical protein
MTKLDDLRCRCAKPSSFPVLLLYYHLLASIGDFMTSPAQLVTLDAILMISTDAHDTRALFPNVSSEHIWLPIVD